MPTIAELVILALVVAVVFGVHKLSDISRTVARWRLGYDKAISEDAIEVAVQNGDHDRRDETDTDSHQHRGTS